MGHLALSTKYWPMGRDMVRESGQPYFSDSQLPQPTFSSQEWVRGKHFYGKEIDIFRQEGIKGRAGTSSTPGQNKPPGDAPNSRPS